jgi:hypothetical protein
MKTDKFKEYLAVYGSDISKWPEILRFAAEKELAHNDSLPQLVEDEAAFEQLANMRVTLADDDFAERIIAASLIPQAPAVKQLTLRERFAQLLREVNSFMPIPHPAYTFAVIAVVGFAFGVYTQPETAVTAMFDGILYESEV